MLEHWPRKSNSVRLGSSPRATTRVGAFGLSAGVLAAGPVHPPYSSEPPLAGVFAQARDFLSHQR
jgi:hypothetical protein